MGMKAESLGCFVFYQGLGGHSDDLEKRIKSLEEQLSGMKRLREKVLSPHLLAILISCAVCSLI